MTNSKGATVTNPPDIPAFDAEHFTNIRTTKKHHANAQQRDGAILSSGV